MGEAADLLIAKVPDDGALEAARRSLNDAGFSEENVCRVLGTAVIPTPRKRIREAKVLLGGMGSSPLEQLIRLLLFYRPVDPASVDAAPLIIAGFAKSEDSTLTATVDLSPFGPFLLVSDLQTGRNDQVMGVAASTAALDRFMVRRKVGSALDLGTGCGVLALAARNISERVTAADVNPRAIRMAALNARLNGVTGIEFVVGNLFGPVSGQRFDLIVCNPPFVVGPGLSPVHSSSGESGDRFCERVLTEVPRYLSEGGFAQVLCNWVESRRETGRARMERWMHNRGCDAWVLHSHTETPTEYAEARARENADDPQAVSKIFDRWRRHLDSAEISGVNFGLVTMRKSSRTKNWFRYDGIPGVSGHCGRSIEAGFLLHDYLAGHQPEEILDAPLTHATIDVSEKQRKKRLQLKEGLTFSVSADPDVAALVENCSGKTTLRSYAMRLAAKRHVPVSYVLPAILAVAKPLIEFGFLLPVDVASKLDL